MKYIRAILIIIPYIIIVYPKLLLWSIFYEKIDKDKAFKFARRIVKVVNFGFNVKFKIINGEQLNNTSSPVVYILNHQSNYDPFLFVTHSERSFHFIAKKEIKKFPLVGRVATLLGCPYIDRENPRKALKLIQNETQYVINGGIEFVCPEGTRSKDREILEFKSGAFKLAKDSNSTIVPVVINNTYKIFKFGLTNRNNPVDIQFLPPILPNEYSELSIKELAEKTQKIIETAYNKLRGK